MFSGELSRPRSFRQAQGSSPRNTCFHLPSQCGNSSNRPGQHQGQAASPSEAIAQISSCISITASRWDLRGPFIPCCYLSCAISSPSPEMISASLCRKYLSKVRYYKGGRHSRPNSNVLVQCTLATFNYGGGTRTSNSRGCCALILALTILEKHLTSWSVYLSLITFMVIQNS